MKRCLATLLAVVGMVAIPRDASTQAGASPAEPALKPVPQRLELDGRKIKLGRRLFHDRGLSRDGTIACASCHNLQNGGADGRKSSVGVGGATTGINAPTVLNAGFNFRQFWNGRADSLEAQIEGPIHDPQEMANTWPRIVARLIKDVAYEHGFRSIYPDGVTPGNIKDALATFERSLITPDAPFDLFLRGSEGAVGEDEKRGYGLFKTLGCIDCHNGVNVGGDRFERFGKVGMPSFLRTGRPITAVDFGRYSITRKESDLYRFKVPTLRNVVLTAPYFHDGSAATLAEAIQVMAEVQLGVRLGDEETRLVGTFLRSLTGKLLTEGPPHQSRLSPVARRRSRSHSAR